MIFYIGSAEWVQGMLVGRVEGAARQEILLERGLTGCRGSCRGFVVQGCCRGAEGAVGDFL